MRRGTDRQTDRHTRQTRVTSVHFASSIRLTRNVINYCQFVSRLTTREPVCEYTVSTKKRPKHALKFSKLASFAQFQFNSINVCLFSIKEPILVKIFPTVIEILTFNKWSQKFTVSRSMLSYLQSMELCLVPKIMF